MHSKHISCAILLLLTYAPVSSSIRSEFTRSVDESLCAEDEMPTPEENQYCHYLNGDEKVCQADAKCRWVDLSVKQTGEMCKPKCKSAGSTAAPVEKGGLGVPKEVEDAVRHAREVAEAAQREANSKVEAANKAWDEAKMKKAKAEAAAQAAAEALKSAEAKEQDAKAAKEGMEEAAEVASAAGSSAADSSKAWKEAAAAKQQKRDAMAAALEVKRRKETEWKMDDESLKNQIAEINPRITSMESEIAGLQEKMKLLEGKISAAKSLRQELGQKRTANKATRLSEGKELKAAYVKTLDEYKEARDNEERLQKGASAATAANAKATGTAKNALEAYWSKVNAYHAASEEKAKSQEDAAAAEEAMLEAQLLGAEQAHVKAEAQRALKDALALLSKVQSVYDYAVIFYQNMGKVKQPTGNPMMNVMLLVQDPSMKPTLASYNVVITTANAIGAIGNAKVLSNLQVGLTKIDSDRYSHFAQWCGDENFVRWIWGANEIEKEDLRLS